VRDPESEKYTRWRRPQTEWHSHQDEILQIISDELFAKVERRSRTRQVSRSKVVTVPVRVCLAVLVSPLHLAADVDRGLIWFQRWRHHHPFRPKRRRDDDFPDFRWRGRMSIFRLTMRGSSATCRSFRVLAVAIERGIELPAAAGLCRFNSTIGQSNLSGSACRYSHLKFQLRITCDAPFGFDRPVRRL
jgi:hypothetical protein